MKRMVITGLSIMMLILGLAVFMPELAQAAPKDEICQGVGAVSTGGCDASQGTTIDSIVKLIVNIFSTIIAIVAVVMLMVGGFKITSSGGDSSKVASGKSTILYAVVGLIIVAMAQTIVWFVLQRTTETDEERQERENAARETTYVTPIPSYYTIEFNNKTVL
jgi:heme/copper-type cytochrome/quinol oxidase subunit 2